MCRSHNNSYPQLLQTTVCCNTPGWFSWLVKAAKVFMSKRTMDKFKVCPRTGKLEVRTQLRVVKALACLSCSLLQDCPFVRKYMIPECMPSYLGGPCRCEHQGGCVAGVGNDVKTVRILTKDEVKMMKDFGVKREAEEKVKLAAWLEERQKEADARKAAAAPPPSIPSRPAPPAAAAPSPMSNAVTLSAAPEAATAAAPVMTAPTAAAAAPEAATAAATAPTATAPAAEGAAAGVVAEVALAAAASLVASAPAAAPAGAAPTTDGLQ